jgi:hypothetical protein
MTNSSQFYYSETQSSVNYSTRPSGKLDFHKLMAGEKEFWISPTLLREKKQKKLVLADWTASAWSEEKLARVKKEMGTLIEQGFSIYIWRNGEVVPLDKYHLSTLEERLSEMTMAFTEDVAHAAVTQNKLTYDQVQVIDDYWLNYILSDHDELQPRVLRTSELPVLTQKMADNLISILNSSTPTLEKIVHDSFCKEAHENIALLKKAGISAFVEEHYTMARLLNRIELSSLNLDILSNIDISGFQGITMINEVLTQAKNLKKIDLKECRYLECETIELNQLPNLEEIGLASTQISQENLHAILMAAPNLKKIDLSSCLCLNQDRFQLNQLPNLEKIGLASTDISQGNLRAILMAAPNLKRIDLRSCPCLKQDRFQLNENSLIHLECIDLTSTSISVENLNTILMAAPNLKEINLVYCDNIGEVQWNNPRLPQLEYINLAHSPISIANLQSILKAAPNLKKIDLPSCLKLNGQLQLDNHSLFQLEDIDLSSSNLSIENLQSILKAAPNLKTIDLQLCRDLNGQLQLDNHSLSQLEGIDLSSSNLSIENLQSILKAAPNLKEIKLRVSSELNGQLQLDNHSLSQLEDIDLSSSNLSIENLQSILKAAPNLKEINLSVCQQLYGQLQLDNHSLSQLEGIDLSSSNLSIENLQSILKSAPNLKKIDLSRYKNNLNKLFQLDNHSLSQLQEINLLSSSMPIESLKAILIIAPNLKKINLAYCLNLAGQLQLDKTNLTQLEEIDLSLANISRDSLQSILKAAPNLKEIKLEHCSFINGDLQLEENSLCQLENIELSGARLSLSSLNAILKAAPNLNKQSRECLNKEILKATPKQKKGSLNNKSVKPSGSDSESISPIFPPSNQNPSHDPLEMKNFKPQQRPFEFKGINTTKNQGMIIEKLSQYLIKTNQHRAIIPELQEGICLPLSHYFMDIEDTQWNKFINKAQAWNGMDALDDGLKDHFNQLYRYVEQYQFSPQPSVSYLGDNLASLLQKRIPCILTNPWHAIAIKPTESGWRVYDPNYVTGCLDVTNDELLKTIHTAIGRLVSVNANSPKIECKIDDPNQFIAHGGLLALCSCANPDEILSKLPVNYPYDRNALDGILLRSMAGKPAWMIGLNSNNPRIREFTQRLKSQFESNHPDAVGELTRSSEALTPVQKNELITTLVQESRTESDEYQQLQQQLVTSIRTSANKPKYIQALKTWDKTPTPVPTVLLYAHQCLNVHPKKQLIELDSEQHLDTLRWQLQQQAINTGRPVFYIDNPSDLNIAQGYIQRDGSSNSGNFVKGAAGALHAFLKANEEGNPLLIVNYDRFNSDEMVTYNGLLDEKPNAVGTALPVNTMIIGLMNKNKPNAYTGSDFYSRFDSTQNCPLTHAQLKAIQSTRTVEMISEQNADTTVIKLYGASDWKEQLLGGWVIDGDRFQWKEGLLLHAVKQNKPIEIKNGLWGDKEFNRFWSQALSGPIFHEDQIIEIPQDIKLVRQENESYEWQTLKAQVLTVTNGFANTNEAKVLNLTCLEDFYGRYELEARSEAPDDNKLIKKEGWLQLAQGQTLDINVTCTLNDNTWARLLDKCQQLSVKLKIHCAPHIELPAVFHHLVTVQTPLIGIPQKTVHQDLMITSTDIDTTVEMLKKNKAYEVIDVSECTSYDLLVRLDGNLNQSTSRFNFMQSNAALTAALADNKNIILKGVFSPELLDSLAPLWLDRDQKQTTSQIIFVSDDAHICPYAVNRYSHEVSVQDKINCLPFKPAIIHKLGDSLEKEPLSRLMARGHYLQTNPSDNNSDHAWQGMNSLLGNTQASTARLNTETSALETAVFTKARIAKVNERLESAPYVFLTGLSGVGKSTFVEKELCKNETLYLTEDQIEAWAMSHDDGRRKILFLDEANLSPRQWSEFEGLFNTPPTLLVNGVLYPLTANHKVVFAGNPANYGDERQLAPFFQRHGHALLFTPLPPAAIYEKVLKPVFAGQTMNHDLIADRILAIYGFICECSTTEILISPRELQMMALLTMTRAKRTPEQNINQISEHISYELAKNLVPPLKRADFDRRFKPDFALVQQQSTTRSESTFLVTPSRQRLSQQLDDLFYLRQWRRGQTDTLNQAQQGGGLGGIIIEGAPGIGKSELVIAALIERGYEEQHNLSQPTRSENPFYRMPVSMPLIEKEALLIKAFNEGAVVMIDEINSSPMMERLLNDLLMGKNPKRIEGITEKPGFMVIGTQNPVTMAGRRAASTALLRRLISTQLPEYTRDEIKIILVAKGIESNEADSMIEAYEETRAFAIANRRSPVPNFRDLIRLADDHLKSLTLEKQAEPVKLKTTNDDSSSRLFQEKQLDLNISNRIDIALVQFMKIIKDKKPPYYVNEAICQMEVAIRNEMIKFTQGNIDCNTFNKNITSKIKDCTTKIENAERTWGEFISNLGRILYEICTLKPKERTFQKVQLDIKLQIGELKKDLDSAEDVNKGALSPRS